MNLRKQIEALRDDVRGLVDQTENNIDPLRLAVELDRILKADDKSSEHVLRKYERRVDLWKESRLEMTRAVIAFGQGAIRSLTLINGGAAIATMTFVGNVKTTEESASYAATALLLFSIGVALAALVAGFAYVTQYFYDISSGRVHKAGMRFHGAAMICALGSLVCFLLGIYQAYLGL